MLPILFKAHYFTLYTYPLFMGLAWGFGFYFTQYLFLKNKQDPSLLFKLFLGVFVFSWIGAKIFFLLFSAHEKINQYFHADYFWLGGGFVFYGGLIFGLIYFLIYSLWFKKFKLENVSLLIPGLIFGHAIGRLGCFLTGCCFGDKSSLPWAVWMNDEYRHPVQLYEAGLLWLLGLLILFWIKRKKSNIFIFTNYLLFYSALRFWLEFLRGDDIRGHYWFSLSTSQLVSIFLFASLLLFKYFQKPGKALWKN